MSVRVWDINNCKNCFGIEGNLAVWHNDLLEIAYSNTDQVVRVIKLDEKDFWSIDTRKFLVLLMLKSKIRLI